MIENKSSMVKIRTDKRNNGFADYIDSGIMNDLKNTNPDIFQKSEFQKSSLDGYIAINPNPAIDEIVVITKNIISRYQLISIDGKVRRSFASDSKRNTIDISSLKKGVYVIQVVSATNGTVHTSKFIKQ